MASNKQRDDAALRKAREDEAGASLFGNLIQSVPIDPLIEIKERFSRVHKHTMMFLLMLNAPDFPLRAGQSLYVGVGSSKRRDSMTVLGNGTIETSDSDKPIRDSLNSAEMAYFGPENKSHKANGWEHIFVENPDRSSVSLGQLIVDHFQELGIGLDVVTDKKALASYLIAQKWNPEPFTKMILTASKKKDAVARKAAKLDS